MRWRIIGENMKNLAEKSKLAMIMLLSGAIISLVLGALALSVRMDGWQIVLMFSIVFIGATIFGVIYELGRPNILIKIDNEKLLLYYKRHWKNINIADIADIDFRNTKSGRWVTNCGTLIIVTKDEAIKIYNVKNVRDVASCLTALKTRNENKK